MDLFDLYAKISMDTSEYKRGVEEAKGLGEDLGKSTENTTGGINAQSVALGNVISRVVEWGAKALVKVGEIGIQYNAQIETYTAALTTALGNEAQAVAAIEQIKKDAAATPYSVDSLVQANSLLISTGESAENARNTIMALTDAISATGGGNAELTRMALNLQQIRNTGKAMSIDLRQFSNAGIDVYRILADYTGKTRAEVDELTVSYDLLSAALQAAASEGGLYFGANAAQAATLNGQISTLKDNVSQKLGEAFAGVANVLSGTLLPAANEFIGSMDMEKINDAVKILAAGLGSAAGSMAAFKAAGAISTVVKNFAALNETMNRVQMYIGNAAIAQAALNGQLTLGQLAVSVLTGKISLATAAQTALNAAMSANPVGITIAAFTALGVAIAGVAVAAKNSAKEYADTFLEDIKNTEDIEEATAKLEEMRAEYAAMKAEFESGYGEHGYTWFDVKEFGKDVKEAEGHVEGLVAAEESGANATEEFTSRITELMQTHQEIYEASYEAVSKYFDIFETATTEATMSVGEMMAAMQSQIDFNLAYSDNLSYLASVGLADLAAALQATGTEGAGFAATIADSLQSAYAVSDEEGNKLVGQFKQMQQEVQESQQGLSETQTSVSEQVSGFFEKVQKTVDDNVELLNKSAEAGEAAMETITGYIAGVESETPGLLEVMTALGQQLTAAMQAGVGTVTIPTISVSGSGQLAGGGLIFHPHASGLDYVPYDGYLAELHKGERVMTAAENREYTGGGSKTIVNNFYPIDLSKSQIDYIISRTNAELGGALA